MITQIFFRWSIINKSRQPRLACLAMTISTIILFAGLNLTIIFALQKKNRHTKTLCLLLKNLFKSNVMKKKIFQHLHLSHWFAGFTATVVLFTACHKAGDYLPGHHHPKKDLGNLQQVNLVANNNNYHAGRVDPLLLNAWASLSALRAYPG